MRYIYTVYTQIIEGSISASHCPVAGCWIPRGGDIMDTPQTAWNWSLKTSLGRVLGLCIPVEKTSIVVTF